MIIKVSSRKLQEALIDKGYNIGEAAQLVKMARGNFGKYLRKDRPIQTKTASKFKQVFGDEVVYLEDDSDDVR